MSRECGACSLCCKLMEVEPLNKPPNKWCVHCTPGHGCGIHATRPTACRNYYCQWLLGEFDDTWFPLKSKIVVDLLQKPPDPAFLRFTVDPGYPNRWRQEPYYATIKRMAIAGLNTGKYNTVVSVNGGWTLVLPDKEIPHGAGQVLKYAHGKYDFVPFKGPINVRQGN